MAVAAAIEVQRLAKTYPPAWGFPFRHAPAPRAALEDVSFEVARGEIAALIGPNGAGKSTLLRILAGVLLPSGGAARVAGRDVVGERPWFRASIGWALSDERGLSPRLSVRENLRFYGALYGLTPARTAERTRALAERLEATRLLDRAVRTLSHGERARAALMRALLHEPPVLLIDELTRSLDPGAGTRIRAWLRGEAARSGMGVLVATHDLSEVESLAHRAVLLEGGRVAAAGPWADVQPAAKAVFARSEEGSR